MTESDDLILVRRVLNADPESFNELCQRYYHPLIAIANSVLMDGHLAEDAAQEALAQACGQLPTLKKPEMFGPWVGAICRNIAKDILNEQLRERKIANNHQIQEKDPDKNDEEAILARALQSLPQDLREVIFLKFFNEKSYEQMSKILRITEHAIDGRLRRAKKRIAAYLEKNRFRRQ
ncbi:MAG: sigma-70 family RNA polymerase sigma factor [Sedimentisphaerales bacterium]|nr:sigma-70 family RNA polymerase sigma factor [Sedimentisphaerales bacterium]